MPVVRVLSGAPNVNEGSADSLSPEPSTFLELILLILSLILYSKQISNNEEFATGKVNPVITAGTIMQFKLYPSKIKVSFYKNGGEG